MKKKTCFFVTPIGKIGSDERKRADDILKHVLRDALNEQFEIVRADEVDDPGTITGDIISRLYNSDLVVADLTGTNANVMYEIGIRHSFSRPIVHLCQAGEILPFDLSDERTIFFDLKNLDDISEAKEKIVRASRRAIDARPFRSPVVRALEMDTLFSEADSTPLSRSLVEKLDDLSLALEEVQSDITSLESYMGQMEVSVDLPDIRVLDELSEFTRKFDLLDLHDMGEIAKAAKEVVRGRKTGRRT